MRRLYKKILIYTVSAMLLLTGCSQDKSMEFTDKKGTTDFSINDDIEKIKNACEEQYENKENINIIFFNSNQGDIIVKYGNTDTKLLPHSLVKYITLGIALNEGVVKTEDLYNCTGETTVLNFNMSCYEKPNGHGEITFENGIAKSCPIAYALLAEKLENETIYKYLEKMEFDISSVYAEDSFEDMEKLKTAIGQGVSVTPEELVRAYDKIFNEKSVFDEQTVDVLYELIVHNETIDGNTAFFDGIVLEEYNDIEDITSISRGVISVTDIEGEKIIGMAYGSETNSDNLINVIKNVFRK